MIGPLSSTQTISIGHSMTSGAQHEYEIYNKKLTEYYLAVGKVAYAWNILQEFLCLIFANAVYNTSATERQVTVASSAWYSQQNDRNQRRMLRAIIAAGAIEQWHITLPETAKDDILWLLSEADTLSVRRDEVIHSPVAMNHTIDQPDLTSLDLLGNPLALRLKGKHLMQEFSLLEWRVKQLTEYAKNIYFAICNSKRPWPQKRPSLSRELHRRMEKREEEV